MELAMTSITIELPDDVASQAAQAGMLSPVAIAQLIEAAVARANHGSAWFDHEVTTALAQADRADASWLSHEQIQTEWQAERTALLAGQPLPELHGSAHL